jgi:subtilisin family serine protease
LKTPAEWFIVWGNFFETHKRMKTLVTLGLLVLGTVTALTQSASLVSPTAAYRSDRILVMPRSDLGTDALAQLHNTLKSHALGSFPGIGGLQVVSVPEGETVPGLIGKLQQSGLVEYAEPDYLRFLNAVPNDPKYTDGTLWGLNNTGQGGGSTDADIDAPEGWEVLSSASNIVAAILDTGIRYTHEDLAANMWLNPLGGGCGFNAITGTTNVMDDSGTGHGTMVSGILGAVGNNGKGVTGVAWRVQLMAGKCFDSAGNSSDSLIIACIDYARTNGAHVMVAAFDGTGYSQSLSNAIYAAREAGIIFVSSCGNAPPPTYVPVNVDASPRYPACYDVDNIVSVAYTDRNDNLGVLSNYGATNVDLAAPGEQIHTTHVATDSFYFGFYSGTSFAAPYVAGAFALMKVKYPAETHQQLIARVLTATDPRPSLAGKCATGGRLNLRKALSPPVQLTSVSAPGALPYQLRVSAGPNRSCVIESSTNLTNWLPIHTNTTSAAGTFDYADSASTNAPRYFFRAVSTL